MAYIKGKVKFDNIIADSIILNIKRNLFSVNLKLRKY